MKLRGKVEARSLKRDYYLAMLLVSCKICYQQCLHCIKGARLAPLSAHLPGVGPHDVSEGPGAGMLI